MIKQPPAKLKQPIFLMNSVSVLQILFLKVTCRSNLKKGNSDPGLQSTCLHDHTIKSYVSHNSFAVSSHKHHRLLMFYLFLSQCYYYFHLTKLHIEVHILSMQVFQLSEWYSWDLHPSAILHSVTRRLMPNSAAQVVT